MPQRWIIPSNGNTFDTAAAFANLRELNWSEVGQSSVAVGDVVYLYSSAPDSAISHKCIVIATRVSADDLIDDSAYWRDPEALAERLTNRSWMTLRLLATFDEPTKSKLGLHALQDHGLKGTMSGRQRLQGDALNYIMDVEGADRVSQFWWVNQGVTGVTSTGSGGFTNLWAATKDAQGHTQPSWDSLNQALPGDVVLHYISGYVVGNSRVAHKSGAATRPLAFETPERSGDIGRELLLDQFTLFDIPVSLDEIPIELRRSPRGSGSPFTAEGIVQRGYLFPIEHAVASAVFGAAGLTIEDNEAEDMAGGAEATELYLTIDETDGTAVVKYRREQSALRKRLFGSATQARCGICGRRYPVRYLHTAHVKPRSVCSEKERRDWKNVVIAACLFGCDALFEDGMLTVDTAGVIHLSVGHDETPAFAAFTGSLAGKTAASFSAGNRKYFEWRNAQRQETNP